MSMLSRARDIAGSLQTSNPTCCPLCVKRFAKDLQEDPDGVDALRRDCHELWNALVRLLTLPRNNIMGLRHDLLGNMAECPALADEDHVRYAVYGEQRGSDSPPATTVLFEAAIYALFSGLTSGDKAPVSRAQTCNKPFTNRRGPPQWPVAPEQLFPAGNAVSVAVLVSWCDYPDPLTWPMMLLGCYMALARDRVFPLLVDATPLGLHKRIVDAIALRLAGASAENPDPKTNCGRSDIVAATSLLQAIYNGPDARPEDMGRFISGHEATLFPPIAAALRAIHVDSGDQLSSFNFLATYALALHARLKLPDSALSADILYYRNPGPVGMIPLVRRALTNIQGSRFCGASGCAARDPGGEFRRCGTCKLLRYCGPGCQKLDWRTGRPVPHKIMCPLLAEVARVGDATTHFADGRMETRFDTKKFKSRDYLHLCQYSLKPGLLEVDLVPWMERLVRGSAIVPRTLTQRDV